MKAQTPIAIESIVLISLYILKTKFRIEERQKLKIVIIATMISFAFIPLHLIHLIKTSEYFILLNIFTSVLYLRMFYQSYKKIKININQNDKNNIREYQYYINETFIIEYYNINDDMTIVTVNIYHEDKTDVLTFFDNDNNQKELIKKIKKEIKENIANKKGE